MSVIVTNAKSRIAYNVIKSLSKQGVKVIASDARGLAMSFYSRYTAGHFLYPSPYRTPEKFIQCLIDNAIKFKATAIIPTYEETFLISKHRQEISKVLNFAIPEYEQILLAHNKTHWIPVSENLRIPTPKIITAVSLLETKKFDQLKFPVLIKPNQGGGGWAITEIQTSDELCRALSFDTHLSLPWSRFFIQEKIKGKTICVAMLFNRGKFKAKITYKTIRQFPLEAGQATFRVSIRHSLAEDFFQRFLESVKWHGLCQADFIIEEKSGIPFLIDINPRLWGSIDQAIAAGIDFPYMLYQIITKGDIPQQREYSDGKYSRWLGGDIRALMALICKEGFKYKAIKMFFSKETNLAPCADFSFQDPIPFFIWGLDTINTKLRKDYDSLAGIWE